VVAVIAPCPDAGLDGLSNPGDLVTTRIVHDDDDDAGALALAPQLHPCADALQAARQQVQRICLKESFV